MKIVSFETAKKIKEAGYPQYGHCEDYYTSEGLVVSKFCDMDKLVFPAPTYLEVWLWLWRCRHCFLECVYKEGRFFNYRTSYSYADPEEAIEKAIEYLVENNLIN